MSKSLSIDHVRKKVSRNQKEFEDALRVHNLVTSNQWPEFKAWIEKLMNNLYLDARSESQPGVDFDPNLRAMKMGEWATLRWLIAAGEQYKDISDIERKLREAEGEFKQLTTV